MAVCVGCGLEVNNGILEVNVCNDPTVPNPTSQGGLVCDPDTEDGCLKVVLNDTHAGCGLNASGGALVVDPCLAGGILCGDTADDPEDNCIYVNVQGQGNAICTPLATATSCTPVPQESPNCNGMVRTCDGLWAPPKLFGANGFAGDQDVVTNATIGGYSIDPPGNIPDVPGSLGDGFPGPGGDRVITNNPNYELLFHSYSNPPNCPLFYHGNTFSTFAISFNTKAGELWRFLLWERAAFITQAQMTAPATLAGSPLAGTNWALQASFYIDRRGLPAGLQTIQMNDVSSHADGAGSTLRWEYMITVQQLVGDGLLDNTVIQGTRQYRLNSTSEHCAMRMASSAANINGPILVNFP